MATLGDYRPAETIANLHVDDCLFAWRGGRIVLLGEAHGDQWVVSRGWLGPDTMTDVRRWRFTTPEAFGGQFRRLAREATRNPRQAQTLAAAAAMWARSSRQPARPTVPSSKNYNLST